MRIKAAQVAGFTGVILALVLAACASTNTRTDGLAQRTATGPDPAGATVTQASTLGPATTDTATPSASHTSAPTATRTASATATRQPPTATPSPTWTPPPPTATPTSGPTPDGIARSVQAPILMYHYISVPPADADVYRRDLSVTPQSFETHLRYLASAGFETITLNDLLYALAQGRALPEKPVILTFDDGYRDNFTEAFPLLEKYGMTGHFFVITDFVNQERQGYMRWPDIEEMAAAGQQIGSHSRDHPDLRGKSLDYLVWQALGSIEAIEEHLGYHPRWIAYPSGSYDDQTIAVFRSAGFWGGLLTQQGATHNSDTTFELKRVRVRGSHTDQDLAVLLELDW